MMRQFWWLLAVALLLAAFGPQGQAAILTWDADTGTTGPQDGSGTWNTTNTNWWDGSGNVSWKNTTPDQAIFGAGSGAAGTITLGSAITSSHITFNAPGSGNYLITGGTLTLSGTPTITANVNGAIASTLAGTGFTKAGTAMLTLSGSNTYTGTTTLSAGTLRATSYASALGTGLLSLGGGQLQLANDTGLNFARNTTVTGNTVITSDRLTAGAGVTHTLGTLTFTGNQTLAVNAGANVTSGTAGITFSGRFYPGGSSGSPTTITFDVGAGASLNLSASLNASPSVYGNVIKEGAGTLIISGSSGNGYWESPVVTLSGGTLDLRHQNALGDTIPAKQAIHAYDGTTLRLANDLGTDFRDPLALHGSMTVLTDRTSAGAGVTHTLAGLTFNGPYTLSVARSSLVDSGTQGLTFSGATNFGTNNIGFDVASSTSLTLSGGTSSTSTGSLTKTGSGSLVISGSNTGWDGVQVYLSGGTLDLRNANSLGDGSPTNPPIQAAADTRLILRNDSATNFRNGLTLNGTNVTVVSNRSTAGAGVTHTLGALTFNGDYTLNVSAGTNATSGTQGLTFGATTLNGNATIVVTKPADAGILLTVPSVTGTNRNLTIDGTGNTTISGNITTGTGSLTKSGTGILTLSGANTYSGLTTVSGGVLRLSSADAIPGGIGATGGTSALTINGGVVELANANFLRPLGTGASDVQLPGGVSGFSASGAARIVNLGNAAAQITWGSATFAPAVLVLNETTANNTLDFRNPIQLGAVDRTVNVNANVATMSGALTSTGGGLTKGGPGVLVLTASNSYTGETLVSSGVLRLSSANAIPGGIGATGGTSALTINGGVVELANANFLRPLGAGASEVKLPGGVSGFSASGAARTVNFNNDASTVTWGSATFNPTTFVLNETTANNTLDFRNAIDLGASARPVNVNANTATMSGLLSGDGGLVKGGAGTLVLAGPNTYTGTTTIAQGTLRASDIDASDGASSIGNSTLPVGLGDTTNAGTLAYTGPSVTYTRGFNINAGGGVLDVTTATTTLTLDTAGITGTGGLTKAGPGTLVLNQPSTYGGATTIKQGAIVVGANGALPAGTALTMGDTASPSNAGTLDLGGLYSQTLRQLSTVTVSASNATAVNAITNLGAGQTLAVSNTGTGNLFMINQGTRLTVSGGGALDVSIPSADFRIHGHRGTSWWGLDVSGLASFTVNATNAFVGYDTDNVGRYGSLTLADANTITATNVYVGYSTQHGAVGGRLVLGTDNTLNVGTLYAGWGKANGTIEFNTGLTDPELVLRGASGGPSRANVILGLFNQSGSNTDPTGTLDITAPGSSVDAMIGTLRLGSLESSAGATTRGPTGYFTFNDGAVDVDSVVIGRSTSSGTQGRARGFLTMNGGSLTVNTSFILAQRGETNANTSVSGTFNLYGGTATLKCDLTDGGGTAGGTSTLVLAGGTLDMTGYAIGSAAYPIDSLTFASGGLRNVAEINGGADLIKTTAGTLILSGANAYTGATMVNEGVVRIASATALGGTAKGTTVADGAALEIIGGIVTAAEPLTLTGGGGGGGGALRNISGNNTFSGPITLGGPTRINSDAGTLTLNSATPIDEAFGLTFGGAGNIAVSTPLQTGAAGLTKDGAGTLTLTGANTYTGDTLVSAGTLAIGGGGSIGLSPNIHVALNAVFDVTAVSPYALASGQTLTGNGTVVGDLDVALGALISAGNTPGHLMVDGSYTQSGTMLVELGGTSQGATYDWIEVFGTPGTAALGGVIEVRLVNGFVPEPGASFDILTATGGITGLDLVQFDLSAAQGGPAWWYWIQDLPGGGQALRLNASPEPTTLTLLALGGLALARRRRRNR